MRVATRPPNFRVMWGRAGVVLINHSTHELKVHENKETGLRPHTVIHTASRSGSSWRGARAGRVARRRRARAPLRVLLVVPVVIAVLDTVLIAVAYCPYMAV